MRVCLAARADAAAPLSTGRHWVATRTAPAIYICVRVEYRHICMPSFPKPRIKESAADRVEVNLSGPRNSMQ